MKDKTKEMLKIIREHMEKGCKMKPEDAPDFGYEVIEEDNFLTRSKILMEEAEKKNINDENHQKVFKINKTTPQFGDVRVSQEEAIVKTVGEQVKFNEDSLLYYPDADDLVLNGEIPSLNTTFQFRYNDMSGEGIYIFCEALQLTEANSRILGKIRDAFLNWKNGLINDADLLEKLKKVSERNG